MEIICLVNDRSLAKVTYAFLFNYTDLLRHLYLGSNLSSSVSENPQSLEMSNLNLKSEESQDHESELTPNLIDYGNNNRRKLPQDLSDNLVLKL